MEYIRTGGIDRPIYLYKQFRKNIFWRIHDHFYIIPVSYVSRCRQELSSSKCSKLISLPALFTGFDLICYGSSFFLLVINHQPRRQEGSDFEITRLLPLQPLVWPVEFSMMLWTPMLTPPELLLPLSLMFLMVRR